MAEDKAADKALPRDVVTLRELARRWGKSEWTISEWIRKGFFTVPVKRIGGIRHVRLRDADKWYDQLSEEAGGVYKGQVKRLKQEDELRQGRPRRKRLSKRDRERLDVILPPESSA